MLTVQAQRRTDPTGTLRIRQRYEQAISQRFLAVKRYLRFTILNQNAFGSRHSWGAFNFPTAEEKLRAFMEWLEKIVSVAILETIDMQTIRGVTEPGQTQRTPWQNDFIKAASLKALMDAQQAVRQAGGAVPEVPVEATIRTPFHAGAVALLYARNFQGLRGITSTMSAQISQELAQGLLEGLGPYAIANRLVKRVEIARTRARVLARTEIVRSYSEASLNEYERLGVLDVTADVEFLTAKDALACPRCRALSGKVYTVPRARGVIPVHPQCLPGDTLITASPRITHVFQRWYDGDLLIIHTASGKRLPCTPNHPILTDGGWIPAQSVHIGSNIVSSLNSHRTLSHMADTQNMPALLHEIAETFFRFGQVVTTEVPVAPEDFNGDGSGSKVCIVGANIEMVGRVEAPLFQPVMQADFERGIRALSQELSLRALAELYPGMFRSEDSPMSGLSLPVALRRSHALPLEALCLAPSPDHHPICVQAGLDESSTHTEGFRHLIARHARLVQCQNVVCGDMLDSGIADGNPSLSQSAQDDLTRDAKLASDVISGCAGEIFFDEVVNIDVQYMSGHVYDLQTVDGYFAANTIITHNCRCAWKPRVRREAA